MNLLNIYLSSMMGGQEGGSSVIIFWVAILAVFYFFMIRPQQKKQKKSKEFRASIAKGQMIVTIGGIHGRIAEVQENTVIIDVEKGAKIKLDKAAISYEAAASEQEIAAKA